MLQLIEELHNPFGEVYFKLWQEPELRAIVSEWIGYASPEEFRKGILDSLEAFKANKLEYIIGNMKRMEGTFDDNNQWLEEVVAPQYVAAGLKKNLMVLSDEIFAQLSADFFREQELAGQLSEPQFFQSVEEALSHIRKLEGK